MTDIGSLILSKLNSSPPTKKKDSKNLPKQEKKEEKDVLKSKSKPSSTLTKVVEELGGDKLDLEMIHQAENASEEEEILGIQHGSSDPKLANELKALVADLGLPGKSKNDTADVKSNRTQSIKPKDRDKKVKDSSKAAFKETKSKGKDSSRTKSKDHSKANQSQQSATKTPNEPDKPEALKSKNLAKVLQRRPEAAKAAPTSTPVPPRPSRLVSTVAATTPTTWLVEPRPIWYDTTYLPPLPATPPSSSLASLPPQKIAHLQARGTHVLTTLATQYTDSLRPGSKRPSAGLSESDKIFIHKILTAGTSADKLSALVMLVSSAPLFSICHLSALLSLSKKKSREESGKAIRAIVNWLRGEGSKAGGLPERKLKYFKDQGHALWDVERVRVREGTGKKKEVLGVGFEGRVEGDEWLAVWCFEEWFKKWYFDFLGVIESVSQDPLVFNRLQSVSHLFYLLNEKAEQEHNLLRLLVNKLGDRDRAVCSRAGYHILRLLEAHPRMKPIVTREVAGLMLGSQLDHGRYYGTITLNQIALDKDVDGDVATKLVEVYFELFRELLGKAAAETEAIVEKEQNEEELEAAGEAEREAAIKKKKKKGRQKHNHEIKEESITESKAKLMSAILSGLNRALPYGALDEGKLSKELETLFRIVHSSPISVSIQALMVIQQVSLIHKQNQDRFYRVLYELVMDHRIIGAVSKQGLFLNMLFKAIKVDECEARVVAFVRRIVQILVLYQAPFVCSALVLLDDLFSSSGSKCQKMLEGWRLAQDLGMEKTKDEKEVKYDGRKREPKYSNASSSPLWELVPLLSHYHPAVALNARELLEGKRVSSTVDTIETHSLSQFLDRFVYKKPKKKVITVKGPAIMQPGLHERIGSVRKSGGLSRGGEEVNTRAFAEREVEQVGVDEVFFHKYFTQKLEVEKDKEQKKKKKQKKKKGEDEGGHDGYGDFGGKGGSDDGSEASESEDEDEVWAAMKESMGDLEVDEDETEGDESFEGAEDESEFEGRAKDEDDDDDEERETMMIEDLEDLVGFEASSDQEDEQERSGRGIKRDRERGEDEEEEKLRTNKKEKKMKKKMSGGAGGVFASVEDYAELLEDDEEEKL